MTRNARHRTWPVLAMICGVVILAIFAFRSLMPIAAQAPVRNDAGAIIRMRPNPLYERFRDEQTAILITGGTLLLGGIVSAISQQRRASEISKE